MVSSKFFQRGSAVCQDIRYKMGRKGEENFKFCYVKFTSVGRVRHEICIRLKCRSYFSVNFIEFKIMMNGKVLGTKLKIQCNIQDKACLRK